MTAHKPAATGEGDSPAPEVAVRGDAPLASGKRVPVSPAPAVAPHDGGAGGTPLPGKEWRDAVKAATSRHHAAQRRGRVRRKGPQITGVVKLPPGGDAA